MKQYRWKITWSNGDTEYVGNPTGNTEAFDWGEIIKGEKCWYMSAHIRKVEFIEIKPEYLNPEMF